MEKEINQIIETIKKHINPKVVILFGLRALWINTNESDFDVCVLVNQKDELRQTTQMLYKSFINFNYPIDIIVENFEAFQTKKTMKNTIYHSINKGVVIYESK
ncbi:MAG TPA: nucleotidyltransferase domain-containing protein [Candidatus Kapabacteria bacterium]|nr:nucleotidyltransferase domain-containing protein [Candidatus Kapabacteria bacterium]